MNFKEEFNYVSCELDLNDDEKIVFLINSIEDFIKKNPLSYEFFSEKLKDLYCSKDWSNPPEDDSYGDFDDFYEHDFKFEL